MTEVVIEDFRQVVLANATVTASGASPVTTSFGNKEATVIVNVKGPVTGTSPTLTFTIQEVDPGDETTTIRDSITGAPITGVGTQVLSLPMSRGGSIQVTWAIGGTASPTFGAVYATLVNKGASAGIFDNNNNGPVAVKPASTAAVATDPALVVAISPNNALSLSTQDVTNTGALGALNAAVAVTHPGLQSIGMQIAAGTLIGTIVPEVSFDGGTTWNTTFFDDPTSASITSSLVFSSANTATDKSIVGVGGAGQTRVRVSAYTSGTANVTVRASAITDPGVLYAGPAGAAPPPTSVALGAVAPSGNLIGAVAGSEGSLGVAVMSNQFGIHSNATITTSGSQLVAKNFYGTQEIALIVNVKAAPTGTTPTITFTIQEVDPGDGVTVMGSSASTQSINAVGVYTTYLNSTTSGIVKVSWTVTGTTPSFTQVYSTVVSKVTPTTQSVNSTPTNAAPGIAIGYVTTGATTNVPVRATTYTEQSANFTGSVVSSSANDTSAGTGARTITIYYVDSTGATVGTETATLNGTTAVNLVTSTKCFIEKIVVTTAGSGGSNAGTITLWTGSGGTGTAVGTIVAGDNKTYWAHHYVVTGKTCNITGMTGLNNNSSNETVFSIQATPIPVANQISAQVSDWVTGGHLNQTLRSFGSPIKVAGPSRIVLFGAPGGTPTIISRGSFDFYDQ